MVPVIVGMDPHERTATIDIIDEQGRMVPAGRYGTDRAGYAEMVKTGREFPERVQAI
ncbi:hypothetical protein [Amycolatopsis anabasis]|uniref:hypothetical protein n=1 Tax=Amycolatopsis anabasis TaxID=1840409 RepID=UPI00131C2DFD|nr:hypothetical protein [Amycolatopsis anabasis]